MLYLVLDPTLVDVNAHPAKLEVRFREGRLVHDFLFTALHRSLANVRPEHSVISIVDDNASLQLAPEVKSEQTSSNFDQKRAKPA